MILCTLKAVLVWLTMWFVGTNTIGFIIRGLAWAPPDVEAPTDRLREYMGRESRSMAIANMMLTSLCIVFTTAYLWALVHYWNAALAVAGGILMCTRIPDLIWEIRNDRKVTRSHMPKGIAYTAAILVDIGALPLIWYSLCVYKP